MHESAGTTDVRCSPHTFSTIYLEPDGALAKLSRAPGQSKVTTTEQYIKTLPPTVACQDHEDFSPVRQPKLLGQPQRPRHCPAS